MLYVSLIFELLRARPRLMFWTAALAQALLWVLVPALFYWAPPGDVPIVLAVGHEFQLGTDLGPPLAFWLADIAFRLGGGMFGVYLLAQACVVVALWGIFALGRSILGTFHAVLAVLLMVGIVALSMPTPEFGPALLAMPIWTVILLHYWRAVGEGRKAYWVILAIEMGLLLLTSYLGLLLLALLVIFTATTAQGRAVLRGSDPWICAAVALVVALPYLAWLGHAQDVWLPALSRLPSTDTNSTAMEWARIFAAFVGAHVGIAFLVLLASGWPTGRRERVATLDRAPVDPLGRSLIYFFALTPALAATLAAVLFGQTWSLAGMGPLIVCSGLVAVLAAGDSIRLYRQRLLGAAWVWLLIGPPIVTVAAILVLPWTFAVDLKVLQPANEMGRFFAESFERRTGRPLAIVAGDSRMAALIASEARSRPSLLLNIAPARSPWVGPADVREKGAVVVWPATDTAGTPPPAIRASFPDMVIEVPRAFERPVQGRLPLLRVGWAVIRPQAASPPTVP